MYQTKRCGFGLKIALLVCLQVLLCSVAFANPWEGHYLGTMEGSGGPFVQNVNGSWDLVVNSDGDCVLTLTGPAYFPQNMAATGTINDDGDILMTYTIPLLGSTGDAYGSLVSSGPDGDTFEITFEGVTEGVMEFTLAPDDTVWGTWQFDNLSIFVVNWSGAGTLEGERANPWEGNYGGNYTGTGAPFITRVNDDWSVVVDAHGGVTVQMEGIPFLNRVRFFGSVTDDGDFYVSNNILGVGLCVVSGYLSTDGSFVAEFSGKIEGNMEWTIYEDGSVEGTWDMDKLPALFINWSGSGTLTGQRD